MGVIEKETAREGREEGGVGEKEREMRLKLSKAKEEIVWDAFFYDE